MRNQNNLQNKEQNVIFARGKIIEVSKMLIIHHFSCLLEMEVDGNIHI